MEVAQEEVVTCVGICLLERLQRVAQRLREEEQMVDMLQYATLQAMRRSFEMAIEHKRGISQLELLCEELSREEAAQKQRKEAKKQRRKKRRTKKDGPCTDNLSRTDKDYENEDDVEDEADDEVLTIPVPTTPSQLECHHSSPQSEFKSKNKFEKGQMTHPNESCKEGVRGASSTGFVNSNSRWESSRSPSHELCPCSAADAKHSSSSGQSSFPQHVFSNPRSRGKCLQESGYCSTNSSNLTTPEGSDVACTEGLCNHHSGKLIATLSS